MLFATDRPLHSIQLSPCLLIPTQSRVLPGRRLENTPYAASSGPADSMTNLWTDADATIRHSHISGGRAFSNCHDVRLIESGSVSAECGENLRTLLVGARPAMVVARRGSQVVGVVVKAVNNIIAHG